MVNGTTTGSTNGADLWNSEPKAAEPKQIASKETFLQLLVAQIKNQNPMNPSDGVEFLTQLAQFTELEQLMDMRSDLSKIRETLTAPPAEESGQSDTAA